ncbi:MAG: hypothetical protein MK008_09645 [Bdellovibrionales bacterium]|nr:hypothetical protein [Bdellovibrionales bacterium]
MKLVLLILISIFTLFGCSKEKTNQRKIQEFKAQLEEIFQEKPSWWDEVEVYPFDITNMKDLIKTYEYEKRCCSPSVERPMNRRMFKSIYLALQNSSDLELLVEGSIMMNANFLKIPQLKEHQILTYEMFKDFKRDTSTCEDCLPGNAIASLLYRLHELYIYFSKRGPNAQRIEEFLNLRKKEISNHYHLDLRVLLVRTYLHTKQFDKALATFKEGLEQYPPGPSSRAQSAYRLLKHQLWRFKKADIDVGEINIPPQQDKNNVQLTQDYTKIALISLLVLVIILMIYYFVKKIYYKNRI